MFRIFKNFTKKKIKKLLTKLNTSKNKDKVFRKLYSLVNDDFFNPNISNNSFNLISLFINIKEYNFFIENEILTYDLNNSLPKSFIRRPVINVGYLEFLLDKDRYLLDYYMELDIFIQNYSKLYEIVNLLDRNTDGVSFFNYKIINYYLTNMEKILIDIFSNRN